MEISHALAEKFIQCKLTRSDTSSDTELELLGLCKDLLGKVRGMEGSRDQNTNRQQLTESRSVSILSPATLPSALISCVKQNDSLGIDDVLLEDGVGSFFVRGDDQLVAMLLAVGSQSESVLRSTEELGLLGSTIDDRVG